jgi:hypothetical protein
MRAIVETVPRADRASYGGRMLRVMVRGSGVPGVVLGSGEKLLIGRAPATALPDGDVDEQLRITTLELPRCAPHVSRVVGELGVAEELVRLRWRGDVGAQLSSLFDAPGGARRVTLARGMSALLDEGENQLLLLRGRQLAEGSFADLSLMIEVAMVEEPSGPAAVVPRPVEPDIAPTGRAPGLTPGEREWFVALALAEPWLTGADDYPRPPSNREIYERVLGWHGYAWNLERSQRVDDAIRVIAMVAFGRHEDPFQAPAGRRVQNVRFALGRRAAEVGLVTAEDLARVERAAADRRRTQG